MNKEEFLKKLDSLNLDKDKYCIIASGVMLMHGLREKTNDVDIRVTKDVFDELMNKYNMKQSERYDYVYELNDFDINCKDFIRDNIEFIEGYPVEKIELQLEWMIKNKREKDKEKIEIIKNYLKK